MVTRASVRVPATSANLGPGFDALGLALALYDEVTAEVTGGGVTVTVRGQGADDLPGDDSHLVVRAMHAAFDTFGSRPAGLAVTCRNRIPQARGLGSSSAAIVAGLLLARALVEKDEELRPRLREKGLLTRDPRKVERKKPGRPGARAP